MSIVTVAATQMACSWDRDANVARAEKLIREAAAGGAQVILIQELFETPYFCKDHLSRHLQLARPLDAHPAVEHFRALARELAVVLPVSVFERAIDASDAAGARARFALIQTPDQPEGRINLVRHLTPEALWQERFLRHPNNAAGLAELHIAVAEPVDSAARLSRLAGCVVVPDPTGGLALDLRRGRIRLLPPSALAEINVAAPALPCMVGLTLLTSDANAAIGHLLTERDIAHRRMGDGLLVDPNAAGGVALRFAPSAAHSRDIAPRRSPH